MPLTRLQKQILAFAAIYHLDILSSPQNHVYGSANRVQGIIPC